MPSDLYRVIYTVQRKKSLQQNRLDPRHTGSAQFTMSQICVCHNRGAGPDPSQWLIQDSTLTRELPAKLEEFLWCKGCSWKLLIIKTRLGQSLLHRFQMSRVWALMFPSCQIAGYSRMYPSCSTLQTLLPASLFPRQLWSHCLSKLRQTEPCRG